MCKDSTLYISDLDGTLLNSKAELSGYTLRSLNAMIAQGLHFSIATARTAATVQRILEGLHINVPVALMNGVMIYDLAKKQYLQVHTLDSRAVREITGVLRSRGTTALLYTLRDGLLTTYYESLEQAQYRAFVEERTTRYGKTFVQTDNLSSISPEHTVYFALLDSRKKIEATYDTLKDIRGLKTTMYRDTYNEGFWYLELFSEKASKENALRFLRERYGFAKVVGFGDNLNDLPLFKACDRSVAVGNAKDEVKAAAQDICGTNDEDGVARWMESHHSMV